MSTKLLITDLDNTLYDWVTFFTLSFRGMVDELVRLLEVPEDEILREFQVIHQRYGNSEQPFAALELPALRGKFPQLTRVELANKIDPALHRFNSIRRKTLRLYPGVVEVLDRLFTGGIKIVGHTEAIVANSYWRLKTLEVERFFTRLYALEGGGTMHKTEMTRWVDPPSGFVTVVPRKERKPNPELLADICNREGVALADAYYLGDSLVRDISMAEEAGVTSIWARYGTKYDPIHWAYLVKVTHWTEDDVRREKDLKARYGDVHPDYTIDSFHELERILIQ